MAWNAHNETDEAALRRIMARLVAMAALAERTAASSLWVRTLVYWLMHRAELAAHTLCDARGCAAPHRAGPIEPSDLLRVAMNLLAIAARLAEMLAYGDLASVRLHLISLGRRATAHIAGDAEAHCVLGFGIRLDTS